MIRRQLPVYSPLSVGALMRAVASGWNPLTEDPVEALTELLKSHYQADRVTLLGSGTQALTLAIRMARRDDNAPVALPAFTCYDVGTAAVGADASVILYDIDPDTLGPAWDSLEAALERGARSIVIAYLYGVPVHWNRVEDLAERYGATVIEDAAQGIGGAWHGRTLGSLGPLSVLSFGRGKGWTGGRGGALLLREGAPGPGAAMASPEQLSPPAPLSRARVLTGLVAQLLLARPSLYGLPYRVPWLHLGETRYREPGPVRRVSRIAAAHVLATARTAQAEVALRRRLARELAALLEGARGVTAPVLPEDSVPGHLRLPCRVTDPATRRQILARLGPAGVAATYPSPLGELPAVRRRMDHRTPTPGAETLVRQLVTFPTHSRVTRRDVARFREYLVPGTK